MEITCQGSYNKFICIGRDSPWNGIPLGICAFAVNVLLCYFQRQRERPESTEMSPRHRSFRRPDIHIEDERNGLLTYESPPRNRTRRSSESRIYDSDFRSTLHDISWAQFRHTDTAMYSEADELSMSESVEMSDFDDNYQFIYSEHERGGHDTRYIGGHVDALPTRYIGGHVDALPTRYIGGHVDALPTRYIGGHVDALPTRDIGGHVDALPTRDIGGHVDALPTRDIGGHVDALPTRDIGGHVDALPTRDIGGHVDALPTRDIGGHVDAPPSYHEAIALEPPNKTSFNNSPRNASPPSYDDFLTNQSRYATSS